jgi:hypothetical protein
MVHSGAEVESEASVRGEGFSNFGIVEGDYSAAWWMERELVGIERAVHL